MKNKSGDIYFRIYPAINQSNYPDENSSGQINAPIIQEFKTLNNLYLILNNYLEDKIENDLLTFKRNVNILPVSNSEGIVPRAHSDPSSSKPEEIAKMLDFDNDQIFLSHYYKNIPEITDDQLQFFEDLISFYMKKQNGSLSHLQGFSFTDNNGHLFPIALTDRPSQGPLISLFSQENVAPDEGQNHPIKAEITSEHKFAMIVQISQGVAFIHKNNFIHSNLNPTTVYLNQKYEPLICDYVFYPQFQVKKNPDKDDEYTYSIDSETALKIYQKVEPYVAPEILKGGSFGQPADIYSLGALMLFILSEKEPKKSENGGFEYPPEFPEKWKEMIDKCTTNDPTNRLTLDKILEILLNEEKATEMIASLEPKKEMIRISENTNLLVTIIRRNIDTGFGKVDFNIFKWMIPNTNDIEDDVKRIISAAENGHIKSIEKVAEYFMTGKHNFYADKVWAFNCYQFAANKNSLFSLRKVAEFYEEGIGTDIDLEKSVKNYKKLHELMDENDPERSEIERKINEVGHKMKTLILKDPKISTSEVNFRNVDTIEQKDNDIVIRFKTLKGLKHAIDKIEEKKQFQYQFFYSQKVKTDRFDSLEKNLPKLNLEDFYQLKKDADSLGDGAFAEAYKVYKKGDEKTYAAKVFSSQLDYDCVNSFKREIIMSSQFKNHPAIVQYVGFNEYSLTDFLSNKKDKLFIVKPTLFMEYVPNGDLEKAIQNPEKYNWNDTMKLKIIIGIAAGLAEIHKHNIIHRDLKPMNILLNENNEPVICDLGCARQYSKEKNVAYTEEVGTRIYMAPEMYKDKFSPIYSCEVDSYSFGIILYQVLTLTGIKKIYPILNGSQIMMKKLDNFIPPLDKINSDLFKNLIRSCWNTVVDERLKPSDIFKILVEEVYSQNCDLLPDADFDEVKRYILKLNSANEKA